MKKENKKKIIIAIVVGAMIGHFALHAKEYTKAFLDGFKAGHNSVTDTSKK